MISPFRMPPKTTCFYQNTINILMMGKIVAFIGMPSAFLFFPNINTFDRNTITVFPFLKPSSIYINNNNIFMLLKDH